VKFDDSLKYVALIIVLRKVLAQMQIASAADIPLVY
jgi:hypothetical protein